MSGPGPPPAPQPGLGPLLRRLRDSEAKRLELERKLLEYRKSDAYLMKLKYMKLKKYLKEIDERQKGALRRNQTFLTEFDRFEAHMKTSSSEMIQKMAWYGREIQSVLSLREGNLSAEGDKEEEDKEQVLLVGRRAGISTGAAVPRGPYHPATVFMGCHTSAVLAAGGLGTWQKHPQPAESRSAPSCSPSLDGLRPESRSADLESDASVAGAARRGDLTASEEGSEQLLSSASDPEPAAPEEEWPRGGIPGPKPRLSKEASWESSTELPVPATAEEAMPSAPGVLQGTALPADGREWGRDAHAAEGSLLQPPNPPTAQEEPLVSTAPGGDASLFIN